MYMDECGTDAGCSPPSLAPYTPWHTYVTCAIKHRLSVRPHKKIPPLQRLPVHISPTSVMDTALRWLGILILSAAPAYLLFARLLTVLFQAARVFFSPSNSW